VNECNPCAGALRPRHGEAVHVDPIKPTLKAPGTNLLKLDYDEPLSNFAFKLKLRRYTMKLTLQVIRADSASVEAYAVRGHALCLKGDFDQGMKHLKEGQRVLTMSSNT